MNYLTNYYKNLSEQLQERINHLQKALNESDATPRTDKPKHLPFEILHVSAPLAYEAPHLYGLNGHDESLIAIYGRHVKEDGTRGPEVVIHPHAFEGIDRDRILDHAHEMIMGKGKVSEDNVLHKTWNGQGGDMPSTINVDPTKVETPKDYNSRIKKLGF